MSCDVIHWSFPFEYILLRLSYCDGVSKVIELSESKRDGVGGNFLYTLLIMAIISFLMLASSTKLEAEEVATKEAKLS